MLNAIILAKKINDTKVIAELVITVRIKYLFITFMSGSTGSQDFSVASVSEFRLEFFSLLTKFNLSGRNSVREDYGSGILEES